MNKRICYFSIDLTNPFGETLLKNVRENVKSGGDSLFVVHGGMLNSPNEWENKRNVLYDYILPSDFDGFIFSNIFSFCEQDQLSRFLSKFRGLPAVSIGQAQSDIAYVGVDNKSGFSDLVTHLIKECGSRNIAVIAGPDQNTDSNERFKTFSSVTASLGINVPQDNIYYGTFGSESAIAAVNEFLDKRGISFDTLVCFNDFMAITAMAELKMRGFRIPEDIKVTGFDNTYESAFMNPSLTTVEYPIEELASKSVGILRSMMDGGKSGEAHFLKTKFIRRKSSGEVSAAVCADDLSSGLIGGKLTFDSMCSVYSDVIASRDFRQAGRQDCVIGGSMTADLFRECLSPASLLKDLFRFVDDIYIRTNEGSSEISILNECFLRLSSCAASAKDGRLENIFSGLVVYCGMKLNEEFLREVITMRTEEEYLLQIGEDMSSSFDVNQMINSLGRYCRYIGIDSFFVVLYDDELRKSCSLIAGIQKSRSIDVGGYDSFPPEKILPDDILPVKSEMIIDALYVMDDDIGYIVYNLGDHPNILYKSLRKQISGALKGSSLVSKINEYSGNLELLVEERTEKLIALNENLISEISRRENAENELLKKRNLESLGILAGGIAHDFNNILTAVSGNINLLEMERVSETDEEKDIFSQLKKAVLRARDLTQQLLTFSKGGAPVKKTSYLAPIAEESAGFLLRGSSIEAEFIFNAPDLTVDIDTGQINQVINNIVINAMHVMPGGGKIIFTLDSVVLGGDNPFNLKSGEYARLSVSDTGSGIPKDIIGKIFDPYFSTKEKGSGLGLATSLAVIKRHGGDISVKSKVGHGSVFDIYLPVSEKTAETESENDGGGIAYGLKFLVLEDDKGVQNVASAFIAKAGGICDMVADGNDAVAKYRDSFEAGEPYDILILDLTIPGGPGGREVMARIREINPGAAGIVSSGYSDSCAMADFEKYGFRSILRKPYFYDDFRDAVLSTLHG